MKFVFAKYGFGFGIWHIFIEMSFYQDCSTICGDRPLDDTYKSRFEIVDNIAQDDPLCSVCLNNHLQFCYLYFCNNCLRLFVLDYDPESNFICQNCNNLLKGND